MNNQLLLEFVVGLSLVSAFCISGWTPVAANGTAGTARTVQHFIISCTKTHKPGAVLLVLQEVPSHLFEHFCKDPRTLHEMSRHCLSGEPLPLRDCSRLVSYLFTTLNFTALDLHDLVLAGEHIWGWCRLIKHLLTLNFTSLNFTHLDTRKMFNFNFTSLDLHNLVLAGEYLW